MEVGDMQRPILRGGCNPQEYMLKITLVVKQFLGSRNMGPVARANTLIRSWIA